MFELDNFYKKIILHYEKDEKNRVKTLLSSLKDIYEDAEEYDRQKSYDEELLYRLGIPDELGNYKVYNNSRYINKITDYAGRLEYQPDFLRLTVTMNRDKLVFEGVTISDIKNAIDIKDPDKYNHRLEHIVDTISLSISAIIGLIVFFPINKFLESDMWIVSIFLSILFSLGLTMILLSLIEAILKKSNKLNKIK